MSEPIHDPEAVARHREQLVGQDEQAEQQPEAAPPRPCPVPVRPGWGRSAYAAGCEDEWIDRMKSRYGEEY